MMRLHHVFELAKTPAKSNMAEAAIPFGQPVDASGFTFGFEAEFIISQGYMVQKSMLDLDEAASNEGVEFLERYFDMPDLDEALAQWQEEHPNDDVEDMLSHLGAQEFLKRVDARLEFNTDARYDPKTGQFGTNEKSQYDALYDVAEDLSEEVGIMPTVFSEDHARNKRLDDWYLEPDATVGGEPMDYDAELTSPVIDDYDQFLDDLRYVLSWIGKEDTDWMYTNGTCGLHINIGPPRSFDPIKFIVFAGENWMAKLFPRADSTSTQPLLDALRDKATFARSFDAFIRRLRTQAKALNDKMFTVNFLPWFEGKNYVEVRVLGGKGYEKRFTEIKQHIDRLLQLFKIASEPTKYRRAYMQKVYRYLIGDDTGTTTPPESQAVRMFVKWAIENNLRFPDDRWLSPDKSRFIARPAQVFEWVVTSLNRKPPPMILLKLICREIGLKQSQVDDLPNSFPRYAREQYEDGVNQAVIILKQCAVPG